MNTPNKKSSKKLNYKFRFDWPDGAPPPKMRDLFQLFEGTGVWINEDEMIRQVGPRHYEVVGSANENGIKEAKKLRGMKILES